MQSQPLPKCLLCEQSQSPGDLDSCGQRGPRTPCQRVTFIITVSPFLNCQSTGERGLTWSLVATAKHPQVSLEQGLQGGKTAPAPRRVLDFSRTTFLFEERLCLRVKAGNLSANREKGFSQPSSLLRWFLELYAGARTTARTHSCFTRPGAHTEVFRSE